ncbi:twin-arginine translocation signal domain-containing protein, partial [candidate division KSB1 bacterium]
MGWTRRTFYKNASYALAAAAMGGALQPLRGQSGGERPVARPGGIRILNPRNRVPVSLIIDDSTCL